MAHELHTDGSSSTSRSSQPDTDDDKMIALMLTEEYSKLDGAIARRLSNLAPIPVVPRVNSFFPTLSDANSDHERLLQRLQVYGLFEVRVSGDGNCQFRALSDQMFRSPDHHKFVRKEVIKQLKEYKSFYEGYVPMKYKRYYKKMAKSGEWGDHLTLQAAADRAYTSGLTLGFKYQDTCAALADSQARLRLAKAEVQGLECRLAQMTKDLEAALKDIQRLPNLEAALDESRLLHGQALSQIDELSAKVKEMETNEDGLGLYYGSVARIELLRLPPGSVSLESEIAEFRHLFPDCVVPGEEAEVGEGSVVQMAVDAGDVASGSGLAPPPSVDGRAIPDVLEQTSAIDEV